MRFSRRTTMALVAGGAATTQAISLSNFTPRLSNLPSDCQAVYTTTISGCQASDFTSNQRCSSACVNGLLEITKLVDSQCKDANVADDSIIGVFLNGEGVQSLCPGVDVQTIQPSSTPAPAAASSSAAQSTTSSQAQSSADSSSSTASQTSATSTASSAATSAANAPVVSSNPPPQDNNPTSTSSSAKSSKTGTSQKSNPDSGGGSPFDVESTGGSASLRSLATGTLLGLVAVIFASL